MNWLEPPVWLLRSADCMVTSRRRSNAYCSSTKCDKRCLRHYAQHGLTYGGVPRRPGTKHTDPVLRSTPVHDIGYDIECPIPRDSHHLWQRVGEDPCMATAVYTCGVVWVVISLQHIRGGHSIRFSASSMARNTRLRHLQHLRLVFASRCGATLRTP